MVVPANSAFAEGGGELEEPPVEVTGGLLECGKIHHPPPDAAAPPSPRPLKTPSSVVAITNYQNHDDSQPPIVFPPVNHENLHISSDTSFIPKQLVQIHKSNGSVILPPHHQKNSYSDSNSDSDSESDSDSITNSNSSSTFPPSDSSPIVHSPLLSSPRVREAASWFDSWTETLHSTINGIMRFLWSNLASSRGMYLTFRSAAITAMMIVFLYFRQRRRLRVSEESRARLAGIIKDRDERINQLLDQISQMNQVLLAPPSNHTSS